MRDSNDLWLDDEFPTDPADGAAPMADDPNAPPHDATLEAMALRVMVESPSALQVLAGALAPGDFFDPGSGAVFHRLQAAADAGRVPGWEWLRRELVTDSPVGRRDAAAIQLAQQAQQWDADPDFLADQLRDLSGKRKLLLLGQQLITAARLNAPATATAAEAIKALEAVQTTDASNLLSLRELVQTVTAEEEQARERGHAPAVPTALPFWPNGTLAQEFYVLLAPPGTAKTIFATALALDSITTGFPTVVFPVADTNKRQFLNRLAAMHWYRRSMAEQTDDFFAWSDAYSYRMGSGEWDMYAEAKRELMQHRDLFFIDDTAQPQVDDLLARADQALRRLRKQCPDRPARIIIDYANAGKLAVPGYVGKMRDDLRDAWIVNRLSRWVKDPARNASMVVMTQPVKLKTETGKRRRPTVADLRGGGAWEQEAAELLIAYSPTAPEDRDEHDPWFDVEVRKAKTRMGGHGADVQVHGPSGLVVSKDFDTDPF